MKNQAESSIPNHLRELLPPTPSGTAKLIAAWDGLTAETQIALLMAKKEQLRPAYLYKPFWGPAYLYQQIIEKALTSENGFVRYLAAREVYVADEDQRERDLRAQIDNDPEPLVRYARLETDFGVFDSELENPEKFFALPHEARLAKVRRLTGSGETVANLVSYAVEHQLKDGQLSEIELFEILAEYLHKPEFDGWYVGEEANARKVNYDGYGEFLAGEDIDALWELVPKVPENISHVIIEHLPESAGLSSGIPKQVLAGMSDRQLETLFDRSDIGLEKFRKLKFFEAVEADDEEGDSAKHHMARAAVTHGFHLTNEEFAKILSKPDKQRTRILENLSEMAQDLRLCLYAAIHDALYVTDTPYEYAECPKGTLYERLEELKGRKRLSQMEMRSPSTLIVPSKRLLERAESLGDEDRTRAYWRMHIDDWRRSELSVREYCAVQDLPPENFCSWLASQRHRELLELKLYSLATKAVPWKKEEEGYPPSGELAFFKKAIVEGDTWATFMAFCNEWQSKPSWHRTNLEKRLPNWWGEAGEEDDSSLDEENIDDTEQPADRVAMVEAVNSVKAELAELRRIQNRQRVFAWIVIGLLVALLFAKW